ncbi:hypothetical protein COO91_03262 [Nostoc flagelliforme CCNUN1]|uniref:Uncharacterized protein n=1 Tax=Nostoc flagelliforme CCNUN1 TaxID=2038116 RepID=A0A2K8SPF0_9NOSO|nr:hypothetical protein COO91_03262 [Nostoc flagelliforme CCNUN1]
MELPQVLQYCLKITLVLLGIGHWALVINSSPPAPPASPASFLRSHAKIT